MNASITKLTQEMSRQAGEIPAMYGHVDFSLTPERFTTEAGEHTQLGPKLLGRRPALLANKDRVALTKIFTMHGDPVADAYAALIPKYGFHRLAAMLGEACDRGLSKIEDAPAELTRFVSAMEVFPAWLDAKLIDEGARLETQYIRAHSSLRNSWGLHRNLHEQVLRIADGPNRSALEQGGGAAGEGDGDFFYDERPAGSA
ncbi:MAG: hypothetical protein WDM89_02690 [Rhizomicrobium sp.]